MEHCPCGSKIEYSLCCEPLLKGNTIAETAEQLMRSRYTAYVKSNIDYILQTILPQKQKEADAKSIRNWSEKTDWQALEIIKTTKGQVEDETGVIEFIAHYKDKAVNRKHHELGKFKKHKEKWYYEDSDFPTPKQVIRTEPKVRRNDLCPCGSSKKFKKCCGV